MLYKDAHEKKYIRTKNKSFCSKILSSILALLVILIIVIIILSKKKGKNNLLFFRKNSNTTNTDELKLSEDRLNTIKNELTNAYNNNREINVIKFFEDIICQKAYTTPDLDRFKSVHIAVGFSECELDNTIKHLASALYHSATSTFLHIHMLDADTLSLESLLKLKNMIYKINNNTEIIVYNAAECTKSFSVREGSFNKFSKEYAKLYAFKLLKNIPLIIFLDSDDLMVQKDLGELYSLEMKDIYGRGLPEVPSLRYPVEWMDKYLSDKSHYINGGVVLVNLELCQKDDLYHKAKNLNNPDFYTKTEEPFQDVINILMKKKIEFFHPKFNKINFYETVEDKNNEKNWYPWVSETLKQSEKNNHLYTKEELMEADKDPVIIHYMYEKQLNKTVKKYEEDKEHYQNLLGLS